MSSPVFTLDSTPQCYYLPTEVYLIRYDTVEYQTVVV